jgi:hypothetical protein
MSGGQARLHHGSHRKLLWSSPFHHPLPGNGIDAIIVPTTRGPDNLLNAMRLAVELDCVLVTLHSKHDTTAVRYAQLLDEDIDIDLMAIDITTSASFRVPCWETSQLLTNSPFVRQTDLSLKRNIGIMLSRMANWSSVLFLDDDLIFPADDDEPDCQATEQAPSGEERAVKAAAEKVRDAVELLEMHNAVALQVGGFPDHSVVCHAYRRLGGDQEAFVGGGAMVLAVGRSRSFFPDIYNDDWFFLLNGDNRLQPVATVSRGGQKPGVVEQLEFDPFRSPSRACSEELGEVLAEGLYWLLDQDKPLTQATEGYWKSFLKLRWQFIGRVLEMTRAGRLEESERRRRIRALNSSLEQLARIRPEFCRKYLEAWERDRTRWQRHLDHGFPRPAEWSEIPGHLTKPGEPLLTWYVRRKSAGHRFGSGGCLLSAGRA